MDCWNEVFHIVLAVVPVGRNQALNVCQWVHERIAERVSGISAENRFTDFVAVPPLPPKRDMSTIYSKTVTARVRAGTRPNEFLKHWSKPTCLFTLSLVPPETKGWEFDPLRPVVGVSRRWLWRVRVALLRVASLGWAIEDEISSLVGHYTFLALVRRELLATFSAAYAFYPSFGHFGRRQV